MDARGEKKNQPFYQRRQIEVESMGWGAIFMMLIQLQTDGVGGISMTGLR